MEIRKITKNGQINIPVTVYKPMGLENGDSVFIYKNYSHLIIKKDHHDQSVNQCIFRNGKLSIPIELRTLLKINSDSLLKLEAFPEEEMIPISRMDDLQVDQLNYYKWK